MNPANIGNGRRMTRSLSKLVRFESESSIRSIDLPPNKPKFSILSFAKDGKSGNSSSSSGTLEQLLCDEQKEAAQPDLDQSILQNCQLYDQHPAQTTSDHKILNPELDTSHRVSKGKQESV